MARVKRTIIAAAALLLSAACSSSSPRQLLVVTTPAWDAVDGTLQRYERSNARDSWKPVGDAIPVVVGKRGLAQNKKEGDGRAPAGEFAVGPAFGFAESASDLKLPYLPLVATTECVDDVKSAHYNTIVDRAATTPVDWNSSEKMRSVEQYRRGAVVQYNDPPRAGAGSCIFLHIWGGPGHGTAGCTAMDAANLDEVLRWLDPHAKPRLVQYPASKMADVRRQWKLPK